MHPSLAITSITYALLLALKTTAAFAFYDSAADELFDPDPEPSSGAGRFAVSHRPVPQQKKTPTVALHDARQARANQHEAARLFSRALKKHAGKDYQGAISDYLAALRFDDTDPAVHWYLGSAYRSLGKIKEAELEFQKEQQLKARLRSGENLRPWREILRKKTSRSSDLDRWNGAVGDFDPHRQY